jgi:hypothetical protein
MMNLYFFSKVNYLLLTINLHSREGCKIILIILVMSTLRGNKKVLECIFIRMGISVMENIVMVVGMVSSSGSYKMEIVTLENTDGVTNTAMAHNIGLIQKRHTLASMITTGTGMEYQHGHQ